MTLVCQLLRGSNYWCKHMQVHTTEVSINNYGVTVHQGCVYSLRLCMHAHMCDADIDTGPWNSIGTHTKVHTYVRT